MIEPAPSITIQIRQAATAEEVAAITAAILALVHRDDPAGPLSPTRTDSRWARAGRLEALRPFRWPDTGREMDRLDGCSIRQWPPGNGLR